MDAQMTRNPKRQKNPMTPLPIEMREHWKRAVTKLIKAGWNRADAEREVNVISNDKRNWKFLSQRNPVADSPSLVGLGHFVSLTVRTASGIEKSIRPKHGQALWLAWKGDPETGDLIIVEPGNRVKASNEETAKVHREFHGADPVAWQKVAWHPPTQPLERLGFATAITYRIPSKMPSNKESNDGVPTDWKHSFGDFGALDNQSDDKGLHPAVARGVDGTIYLMRRPRNKYRLADWLYG